MSSTRHAQENSPLSQGRYMSSPEYADLRGLSGTAVAARAALLDDPEKRRLVWALHAFSLEPGGLKQVAADVLAMFPERLGTRKMRELNLRPTTIVRGTNLWKIEKELASQPGCLSLKRLHRQEAEFEGKQRTGKELVELCRQNTASCFDRFLVDLCINPRVNIQTESEDDSSGDFYKARVLDEFPDVRDHELATAALPGFHRVVDALLEYLRHREESARKEFVLTAVGSEVWQTLDFALKSGGMVLIDGLEGRGKTEAAKAWCRCHPGEARFVSMKGVTSKTTAFREIAKALCIASSYARTATEMQTRIEDVLQRSRLLLVFDEAHFLFNQSSRIYTRPELIDWLVTLFNQGVTSAFVTTPQFMDCVKRAVDQVGWNWKQFRRRVKRYVQLPQQNTKDDIERIACKVLSGAPKSAVKLAVGYAILSKRDLSAVGDVANEARFKSEQDGRTMITHGDVEWAINEFLLPSDEAFALRMGADKPGRRKPSRSVPILTMPEDCGDATETPEPPATRRGSRPDLESGADLPRNRLLDKSLITA